MKKDSRHISFLRFLCYYEKEKRAQRQADCRLIIIRKALRGDCGVLSVLKNVFGKQHTAAFILIKCRTTTMSMPIQANLNGR